MAEVSYVHTGGYTTKAAEELAHELLDGNPFGLERAIFVGSGKCARITADLDNFLGFLTMSFLSGPAFQSIYILYRCVFD